MEITGNVIEVEKFTGVKDDSTKWTRYEVTINHQQGQYPKNATLLFSGEKWSTLEEMKDKNIRIYFDIDSTKYKERNYNRLKAYRYESI